MRVTPSLPQRGRQPKGGIPLTPIFQGNIVNLNKDYHNRGMPEHLSGKSIRKEPPIAIYCFYAGLNKA